MSVPHPSRLSRRLFLTGAAATAATTLLAACGGTTPTPTAPPAAATTVAASAAPATLTVGAAIPTASAATSVATAMRATATGTAASLGATGAGSVTLTAPPVTPRTAASRGELRYATTINFPNAMEAHKAGFYVIHYGVGETLTWVTPQITIEPSLAERITNRAPTTWRVTLRPNVKFWDGSAMDAAAVAAAFRYNWDNQAAATTLIDKATTITVVDPLILDFTTPRPAGNFPNALSAPYFVIHKDAGKMMTGMYRPTTFTVDKELVVEAVPGHWGGPPPLARIAVRNVVDANTRALALQSGEVDMVGGVLPETLGTFGPELATVSLPSTRVHTVLLNPKRGIFADQQVREATAYAIDRAALRRVVFNDQGAAQATIFPTAIVPDQVQLQTFDQARARQLLDAAGWVAGADGVRAKGGARLAFTVLSYPSRPELTLLAVAIQAQLKTLGYEMQVREVQSINDELAKGEYDASMYSLNTLYTGDPYFHYNIMFAQEGTYNFTKTPIPGMDALLGQLREAAAPAQRQAISRQIQEVVRGTVPALYLISAPLIYASAKAKVADYVPDPQDQYFVTGALRPR